MSNESQQILIPAEAEAFIESLKDLEITEIGSSKWTCQHQRLEKLNMQAIICATNEEDEFIREFLVNNDKIKFLIKDLLITEIWKEKVFTEIIENQMEIKIIFPVYIILYHEGTLVNLLETTFYHQDVVVASDDIILELVDYIHRKLSRLFILSKKMGKFSKDNRMNETDVKSTEELTRQNEDLEFGICMKSLSILRYIIDHLQQLPLSTANRILNVHDIPVLLVHILENSPWIRTNIKTNSREIYTDSNKWEILKDEDSIKLTKIQGQIWLSLYQLLLNQEFQSKYEINSHRKNVLIKLSSFLNEILIDQLPILQQLQRYVQELLIMEPAQIKKSLLIEQIPEMRDFFLEKYKNRWKKIAEIQVETFFDPANIDMQQQAKELASAYNLDAFESLLQEPPKCVLCGHEATKRCSRCKNEWYCRRECQVNHWTKHKEFCDLMIKSNQKS